LAATNQSTNQPTEQVKNEQASNGTTSKQKLRHETVQLRDKNHVTFVDRVTAQS
jgi:hypothetical protein